MIVKGFAAGRAGCALDAFLGDRTGALFMLFPRVGYSPLGYVFSRRGASPKLKSDAASVDDACRQRIQSEGTPEYAYRSARMTNNETATSLTSNRITARRRAHRKI